MTLPRPGPRLDPCTTACQFECQLSHHDLSALIQPINSNSVLVSRPWLLISFSPFLLYYSSSCSSYLLSLHCASVCSVVPLHAALHRFACASLYILLSCVMPRNADFEMNAFVSNNGRDGEEDPALAGSEYTNGSTRRRSVVGRSQDDDNEGHVMAAEARLANRGFLGRSVAIATLIGLWLAHSTLSLIHKIANVFQRYIFSIFLTVVRNISHNCLTKSLTSLFSTTNGCSKIKVEKRSSLFHSSPHVYIWLYNFV
jgi:hypothetical protein